MCDNYENALFAREGYAPSPFREIDVERWTSIGRSLTPQNIETIDACIRQLGDHSNSTMQHVERVAGYVEKICAHVGLPELATTALKQATRLHDMGKLMFASSTIESTKPFTPGQRKAFEAHAAFGQDIIQSYSELPVLFVRLAMVIAGSHHENYDGSGYPRSLAGDAIPVEARLVKIADTFDARAHRGIYQEAAGVQKTLAEMVDPESVRMAGKMQHELVLLLAAAVSKHSPVIGEGRPKKIMYQEQSL